MKRIFLICLGALSCAFAFAQKITVTGVVNDKEGKNVPFAFIKDATHNYATFSDSFGTFILKVDAADRLLVSAFNYLPTVVKVTDPKSVSIVLTSDGTNKTMINEGDFAEHLSSDGLARSTATGYITKEASLHGSRYLFDHWVHGYVLTIGDSIKQNTNYQFNYGKMDGSALITADGKKMEEINRSTIKQFVLYDDTAQPYVFEMVPAIDARHFVQLLSGGSKYKIYKQFGTKFYPNDYVSNGMTSTGHNYDEIKDVPEYYVVVMPTGIPQKFALKSKALKTAFAPDAAKVSKYLSDHDADIDDKYLADLGDYLNN